MQVVENRSMRRDASTTRIQDFMSAHSGSVRATVNVRQPHSLRLVSLVKQFKQFSNDLDDRLVKRSLVLQGLDVLAHGGVFLFFPKLGHDVGMHIIDWHVVTGHDRLGDLLPNLIRRGPMLRHR